MSWLDVSSGADGRSFSTVIKIDQTTPVDRDYTAPPSPTHSTSSTHGPTTKVSSGGGAGEAVSSEMQFKTGDFSNHSDPKGTVHRGTAIVITHASNPGFAIVAGIMFVVGVVEIFMLHRKLSVNERATVELLAASWSIVCCATLLWMYQRFVVEVDTISGRAVYSGYRAAIFRRVHRSFDPATDLRGIVIKGAVTRQDAAAQHQFSDADSRKNMRHSIELSVDVGSAKTENLVVDFVSDAAAAQEAGKQWAGFFQRLCGHSVELAASPSTTMAAGSFPTTGRN